MTTRYGYFFKRWIDVVVALTLLMILAPLFAVVCLLIYAFDRAPIFFLQTRVGKDLRRFKIYKFRTMTVAHDSGDVAESVPAEALREIRRNFRTTATNDARITAIGKLLRKSSMDELPQLLNVLKGDMSLIGPRPVTPMQRADYTPEYWQIRHAVSPGITGLAQISGRSALTLPQEIACDRKYIETCSFKTDLQVLAGTISILLRGKGAN